MTLIVWLVEPKSARSRRVLVLPEIVAEALCVRRSIQVADKLRAGDRWQKSDLVFPAKHRTLLNRHNVTRDFQALLKHSGLPRQIFHGLRHACASSLAARRLRTGRAGGLLDVSG